MLSEEQRLQLQKKKEINILLRLQAANESSAHIRPSSTEKFTRAVFAHFMSQYGIEGGRVSNGAIQAMRVLGPLDCMHALVGAHIVGMASGVQQQNGGALNASKAIRAGQRVGEGVNCVQAHTVQTSDNRVKKYKELWDKQEKERGAKRKAREEAREAKKSKQ